MGTIVVGDSLRAVQWAVESLETRRHAVIFCKKKPLAARRESLAVVSFVYGSGPCSDANRRLHAPVVRPAPVRGRRRGSDASAGDFCFLCGKSSAKTLSKQASTIEILPQIPRRPTLAAREASGGGHTMQQEARNKSGRQRRCRSCSRQRRSGSGGPRRRRRSGSPQGCCCGVEAEAEG